MKNFKRLLCLSLGAVMLLGALVACGKDEPEGVDSGSDTDSDVLESIGGSETETQWETDENGFVVDDIPDTTYDGKIINIVGWENAKDYTLPDDGGDGGAQLLSMIYLNRLSVEARLDVQFEINYMVGKGGDGGASQEALINEISSGASKYDLIQNYSLFPAVMAQRGLLVNFNNLEYPHLNMPWWPESIRAQWEQYDSLYFVANNSSAQSLRMMLVMYSNTDMITREGLQDPVELVLSGDWTVEKMIQYARAFESQAANTPGEIYGLVVDDHSRTDVLYYGAGFHSTENDANGVAKPTWTDAGYRTRVSNYLDTLVSFFKSNAVEIANDSRELMVQKKTALMIAAMSTLEAQKGDTTYAAIPIPKLDKDSEYRTIHNNAFDMWCIPKSAADAELSGLVIEAIASSEYRNIAPYYFETVLKDRYSQNANGMKVFDIIRSSVTYDFGRLCQFALEDTVEYMWRRSFVIYPSGSAPIKTPNNTLESQWTTSGTKIETGIMKLLADFRNNNRAS